MWFVVSAGRILLIGSLILLLPRDKNDGVAPPY